MTIDQHSENEPDTMRIRARASGQHTAPWSSRRRNRAKRMASEAVPSEEPKSGWGTILRVLGLLGLGSMALMGFKEEEPILLAYGAGMFLTHFFLAYLVDKFVQMHFFMRGLYERGVQDDLPRKVVE